MFRYFVACPACPRNTETFNRAQVEFPGYTGELLHPLSCHALERLQCFLVHERRLGETPILTKRNRAIDFIGFAEGIVEADARRRIVRWTSEEGRGINDEITRKVKSLDGRQRVAH